MLFLRNNGARAKKRFIAAAAAAVLLNASAFCLSSCGQTLIWGLSVEEAQNRLRNGDYAFLELAEPERFADILVLGSQAPYFAGLIFQSLDNEDKARAMFRTGAEKSSEFYKSLCVKELLSFGSAEERLRDAKAYEKTALASPDCAARYAYLLLKNGSANRSLALCKKADIQSKLEARIDLERGALLGDPDETEQLFAAVYVQACLKNPSGAPEQKSLERLAAYFYVYPVTDEYEAAFDSARAAFARFVQSSPQNSALGEYALTLRIAQARILRERRQYGASAEAFAPVLELAASVGSAPILTAQTLSDAGKAYLYGSRDYEKSADLWRRLPDCYMTAFYRARLYEKLKQYEIAINEFHTAIYLAPDIYAKENAIWYLLDVSSRVSAEKVFEALDAYARSWTRPDYFADFFDSFIAALARENRWNDIVSLYREYGGALDKSVGAQLAYIAARALETGLAEPRPSAEDSAQFASDEEFAAYTANQYYANALISDHDTLYYRLLAAERLERQESVFELHKASAPRESPRRSGAEDIADEDFIAHCARFGLLKTAYEYAMKPNSRNDKSAALELARALEDKGDYASALRLLTRVIINSDEEITDDDLRLLYPRYYSEIVENAAEKYSLPGSLLYALIRTESFFNAEAVSSAGAVGLAQLMPATASDVARKLRVSGYELTDAATNIQFGAYYIKELIGRLDGNAVCAILSYNGGLQNVRAWRRAAAALDDDLFLETVPFTETRNYGRKVLAAEAIYRYLYQ